MSERAGYFSSHAYLHANAAVEGYLDGVAVIRCLHERGEVTDANLL